MTVQKLMKNCVLNVIDNYYIRCFLFTNEPAPSWVKTVSVCV